MPELNCLPACDILGYGLDFTSTSPLDIKSVIEAIKKARKIIDFEPDEGTRKLKVEGTTYDVPRCIGVTDYNSSNGTYITFKTGSEAASTLKVDASLSVRYMAVSASASASYSIDKSYRRESQWAMYSFNADTYLASLRNYADLLNEGPLARRLEDAKAIGDGTDSSIVDDWRAFFGSWGSHVIVNAAYGARFQLNVWASNSDSSVNENFSASVTAAFDGVVAGGKFDASVTKKESFKTFSEFMQKQVSVVGGDPIINKELTANPAYNEVFTKWAKSVAADSSCTRLSVTELWVLLREASKKSIRDKAGMVKDAYEYIITHPRPYKTAITLDIQSDWAEFNLLSPEAVIIPDEKNPFPEKTIATNTRVQWGKEYSHQYDRKTLRFYIINSGAPIDFSISRGSNGATPGKGTAEVILDGTSYVNKPKADQDNVWNTERFYQKPVSTKPVSTKIDLSEKKEWDALLKEYLQEIGAGQWV